MSNGVKISQAGSDLKNTPDYQLVLSSEKLMMEIAFEKTINESYTAGQTIKIKHGLDYPPGHYPAYEFMGDYSTSDTSSAVIYVSSINETDVLLSMSRYVGQLPSSLKGRLVVYDLDLCTKYFDTSAFMTPQPARKSDVGLKIAREGFAIDNDTGDYGKLSSSTSWKNMIVHMVDSTIAEFDIPQFSFSHNLGYQPTFMLYKLLNPGSDYTKTIGATVSSGNWRSYADNRIIEFDGVQSLGSGNHAIIIFKDPVLIL